MKQLYSVLFLDRKTRKVLRKFDYPAKEIPNKFFWEKIKAEQLNFVTKRHDMLAQDVIVQDNSTVN